MLKGSKKLEFPNTFLHGKYGENHEGILDMKLYLNHSKNINIEIYVHTYPYSELEGAYISASLGLTWSR